MPGTDELSNNSKNKLLRWIVIKVSKGVIESVSPYKNRYDAIVAFSDLEQAMNSEEDDIGIFKIEFDN